MNTSAIMTLATYDRSAQWGTRFRYQNESHRMSSCDRNVCDVRLSQSSSLERSRSLPWTSQCTHLQYISILHLTEQHVRTALICSYGTLVTSMHSITLCFLSRTMRSEAGPCFHGPAVSRCTGPLLCTFLFAASGTEKGCMKCWLKRRLETCYNECKHTTIPPQIVRYFVFKTHAACAGLKPLYCPFVQQEQVWTSSAKSLDVQAAHEKKYAGFYIAGLRACLRGSQKQLH